MSSVAAATKPPSPSSFADGRSSSTAVLEPPATPRSAAHDTSSSNSSSSHTKPLSQVVREVFDDLGKIDVTGSEAREWIAKHYPDFQYRKSSLKTAISSERSIRYKAQESSMEEQRRQEQGQPDPIVTLDDVKKVKSLASQNGGLDAVRKHIEAVSKMSKLLGGFDKLEAALGSLLEIIEDDEGGGGVVDGRAKK